MISSPRRPMTILLDAALSVSGSILYFLFKSLGWPFVARTGGLVAWIAYRLRPGKRMATEDGIGLLVGGRGVLGDPREITRRSFANYYKRHVETFFFGCLDRRRIDRLVEVKGLEHVDAALSKGKGVILLLSHFGSFLLPLPFLGFRGYAVNQVTGRQIHGSLFAERIWEWRKKEADRLPVKFIQVGRFLRPIFDAFAGNELVAIAFDGRDATNLAEADFLGRKVRFSTGPFDLARRTGAVIIPTFMVRRDDDTHLLVLEAPFGLAAGGDKKGAAAEDAGNFAKLFAGYVERYPCHFGMVLFRLLGEPVARMEGFPLESGG
jgi:lauroyl/myristoyl acyltransferase